MPIVARDLRDKPFLTFSRARPVWVEGLESISDILWKFIISVLVVVPSSGQISVLFYWRYCGSRIISFERLVRSSPLQTA